MGPSLSKKLMAIRAQAGALDAELIQVSVAEERYLDTAVAKVHAMSDAELENELARLNAEEGLTP